MRTFQIKITESEMQAFAGVLDAAIRHLGLKGMPMTSLVANKLDSAEETETLETPNVNVKEAVNGTQNSPKAE